MKIQFLGATRTVTGSCYLVNVSGNNLLVDCGMFQGVEIEHKNRDDFEFDPKSINYVFLTHAHLDHCGLLPKLYKGGFRGKVFMTPPTRGVLELMLMDSAKIQEFRSRPQKSGVRFKKEQAAMQSPIYDTSDVYGLLGCIQTVKFQDEVDITDGIKCKFLRVGHTLGAASITFSVSENGKQKKILFSGDIGSSEQKLDSRFDKLDDVDYVVMESLYGGIERSSRVDSEEQFVLAMNASLSKGGNVIIPSFTYQRTQEILYLMRTLWKSQKIPSNVKLFLNSPLAIKVTSVYKQFFNYVNPEIVKEYRSGKSLFSHRNIRYVNRGYESRRIRKSRRSIFLAGHGMCAGGRVIYHLLDNLEDKRSCILFVGFQAENTLGREILDGAREVTVEGRKLAVNAKIVRLPGFSAHASQKGLLSWLDGVDKKRLQKVFLVHAEEQASFKFKDKLEDMGYSALVPEWKKTYTL